MDLQTHFRRTFFSSSRSDILKMRPSPDAPPAHNPVQHTSAHSLKIFQIQSVLLPATASPYGQRCTGFFPPKLQGNRRQMLCCLFHNKLSDRDTSRKENIVKPLFQQLLVFLPAALDHRNIAFREAFFYNRCNDSRSCRCIGGRLYPRSSFPPQLLRRAAPSPA